MSGFRLFQRVFLLGWLGCLIFPFSGWAVVTRGHCVQLLTEFQDSPLARSHLLRRLMQTHLAVGSDSPELKGWRVSDLFAVALFQAANPDVTVKLHFQDQGYISFSGDFRGLRRFLRSQLKKNAGDSLLQTFVLVPQIVGVEPAARLVHRALLSAGVLLPESPALFPLLAKWSDALRMAVITGGVARGTAPDWIQVQIPLILPETGTPEWFSYTISGQGNYAYHLKLAQEIADQVGADPVSLQVSRDPAGPWLGQMRVKVRSLAWLTRLRAVTRIELAGE